MQRNLLLLLATVVSQVGLGGCEPVIRNCPVIGKSPSSNIYHLDYDLIIPADCPVPLASPGTEKKFVAARIYDAGDPDFEYASVKVLNSEGETVANDATLFFAAIAEPSEEYIAATGAMTFADYDRGVFEARSADFTKTAYGETKITYQQTSLATQVVGTEIPLPNTIYTWHAPTSGGYPAYMYQWYRGGTPVGTGPSYTANAGTANFDLRVEVTDQTWSTRAAVLLARVGGIEVSLNGPSLVYASEGGGTWSASGNGGTGSYMFDWYVDEQWVGSGPSWSGYPGEHGHALQVQMRDSAGAFNSRSQFVQGIGDPSGGCQPVPPALIC